MKISRIAPWLVAAITTSCLAWWMAADAATGATGPQLSELEAYGMLSSAAAAQGRTIPKGLETYAHFGDGVIAHAPLAGIERYTEDDFAAGVPIMALVVSQPVSNLVPNGAYVVTARFDPDADTGTVTLRNAEGHEVVLPAYARTPDQIHQLFPGAYDPPPPPMIPNITSTHVWHNGHPAVDCSGWHPPRTIYYQL